MYLIKYTLYGGKPPTERPMREHQVDLWDDEAGGFALMHILKQGVESVQSQRTDTIKRRVNSSDR
jgi:hypothetical protein